MNLDRAMEQAGIGRLADARDQSLARSLAYGVTRWFWRLDRLLDSLLDKPLAARHRDIRCLLLTGLYQLSQTDMPAHAVVSETVEAAVACGKPWARGLVNAVLRNYSRRREELEKQLAADPQADSAHPAWLLALLREDWPGHWQDIVAANNRRAPMSLRVNQARMRRDDYLVRLAAAGLPARAHAASPVGIVLEHPCGVDDLPGFAAGDVSVQDIAAQLATPLLGAMPGMRVLDACAAPGGKLAHVLEQAAGNLEVTAVELEPARIPRMQDNLLRLGYAATPVVNANAALPSHWWDGRPYDRILLDAPCSGSGVIRRHPDIKLLRRADDIPRLADAQLQLLEALWPLLAGSGRLLYVTCSILRAENDRLITRFLERNRDAQALPIKVHCGETCGPGLQILPGEDDMDGFFYACLFKA